MSIPRRFGRLRRFSGGGGRRSSEGESKEERAIQEPHKNIFACGRCRRDLRSLRGASSAKSRFEPFLLSRRGAHRAAKERLEKNVYDTALLLCTYLRISSNPEGLATASAEPLHSPARRRVASGDPQPLAPPPPPMLPALVFLHLSLGRRRPLLLLLLLRPRHLLLQILLILRRFLLL